MMTTALEDPLFCIPGDNSPSQSCRWNFLPEIGVAM